MTDFRADIIERTEYPMTNFSLQGQLYHNIGSAYLRRRKLKIHADIVDGSRV